MQERRKRIARTLFKQHRQHKEYNEREHTICIFADFFGLSILLLLVLRNEWFKHRRFARHSGYFSGNRRRCGWHQGNEWFKHKYRLYRECYFQCHTGSFSRNQQRCGRVSHRPNSDISVGYHRHCTREQRGDYSCATLYVSADSNQCIRCGHSGLGPDYGGIRHVQAGPISLRLRGLLHVHNTAWHCRPPSCCYGQCASRYDWIITDEPLFAITDWPKQHDISMVCNKPSI